jgi:uncharacterized protein YuzE
MANCNERAAVTNFIGLSIDVEAQAGYVTYRHVPDGDRARSKRISENVVADYSETGELLGVEFLGLDEPAIAEARAFAIEHELAFPRDFSGVTTGAS